MSHNRKIGAFERNTFYIEWVDSEPVDLTQASAVIIRRFDDSENFTDFEPADLFTVLTKTLIKCTPDALFWDPASEYYEFEVKATIGGKDFYSPSDPELRPNYRFYVIERM